MDHLQTFTHFLEKEGFELVKYYEQLKVTIYGNEGLYIKIVQDSNGERFIDLSRTNNKPGWEGWYSMDLIYFLIKQTSYEKGGPVYFEELSKFFIDHYEEIIDNFSPSNFPKSEVACAKLQDERAELLFPQRSKN